MVFLLLSLVFCSGFLYFFLPGVCHSVMAAFNLWYFNLIARRTSRYMQHNYYSSFYRITVQVFIRLGLASVFLTCSKLDIGPKLVII
jgi:hypothetical protein